MNELNASLPSKQNYCFFFKPNDRVAHGFFFDRGVEIKINIWKTFDCVKNVKKCNNNHIELKSNHSIVITFPLSQRMTGTRDFVWMPFYVLFLLLNFSPLNLHSSFMQNWQWQQTHAEPNKCTFSSKKNAVLIIEFEWKKSFITIFSNILIWRDLRL